MKHEKRSKHEIVYPSHTERCILNRAGINDSLLVIIEYFFKHSRAWSKMIKQTIHFLGKKHVTKTEPTFRHMKRKTELNT